MALLIDTKGSAVDIMGVTGFYACATQSVQTTFYFVRDTKFTKYQSSLEKKPGKFSTESQQVVENHRGGISNWCSNRSLVTLNGLNIMALSASTVQCNASQSVGTPFESHLDHLILSLSLFSLLAIQFWNSTMKKHLATVSPTHLQLLCKLQSSSVWCHTIQIQFSLRCDRSG